MMLDTIFTKALRDQRWALLGWGLGVVLLVLVESAVWPTMRDMPDLHTFLDSYPEGMRRLFNLDAMASGTGFMNAELFTLMLPLLFIIFGITRGARLVAGEEESGVLEVVLVTPVSTRSLLLQKAAALAASVGLLGVVLVVVLQFCSAAYGMGIGIGDNLSGTLSVCLLGLEFGWLALALGAATGRRAVALGLAGVAAVAAYVLYALGQMVSTVRGWEPLSPFHQALRDGPLGSSPAPTLLWVVVAAVAAVAAAVPVFERRDIHVR